MKKLSKHLEIILSEMCQRVGVTLDDINTLEKNWYQEYRWTEEEQEDFENWLADYFYKNPEAQREMLTLPYRNKKYLKAAAKEFTFDFGWSFKNKLKEDKNDKNN